MVAINHLVHERQKEGVRAASEQSSMDFLLPINASTKYYLVLQPDPTCMHACSNTEPRIPTTCLPTCPNTTCLPSSHEVCRYQETSSGRR